MSTEDLEQKITNSTKGLPEHLLQEILDFIEFVILKRTEKEQSINRVLTSLDAEELVHLEEEFHDYKEVYPRND